VAFWVYMLECADQSYYIGHTDNLEKRISEHQRGEVRGYTSTRRPVRVVFTQDFPSREEAVAAELQIKGWNRKKKEALICGDWAQISALARRRTPFRSA
jgi:tRNA/rRNA methyltransferase